MDSKRRAKLASSRETPWSEWSDWEWNPAKGCLMRVRQHKDGRTNYQYGVAPPGYLPRSSSGFLASENSDLDSSNVREVSEVHEQRQFSAMVYPIPPSSFATYQGENLRLNANPLQSSSMSYTESSAQPRMAKSPYHYEPPQPITSIEQNVGPSPFLYSSAPYAPVSRSEQFNTLPSTVDDITSNLNSLKVEYRPPLDWDQDEDKPFNPEYMSIGNPRGYFKLGRIFKSESQDETFVVVSERSDSSISCVPIKQTDKEKETTEQEGFPIFVENPSVNLGNLLQLDFARQYKFDPSLRVLNVGRIDRNYLKALKASSEEVMGGDQFTYDALEGVNFHTNKPGDTAEFDSSLLKSRCYKRITTSNPNTKEDPLFKEYRVHKSHIFKKGMVFKLLWSEPHGEGGNYVESVTEGTDQLFIRDAKYGEKVYSTIRRFVIVKSMKGHCLCVPISTYGLQGTAKPGVKAEDHAIVYSSSRPPKELEGEYKLGNRPIRVIPDPPKEKLKEESRINYTKTYTVEHNVKVCFIGKIHPESEATFFTDFEHTFNN